MDALLGRRPISIKALFDFSKIDAGTKKHLKNVYASLTIATLAAAAGAAVHLFTNILKGGLTFPLCFYFKLSVDHVYELISYGGKSQPINSKDTVHASCV